MDNVLHCDTLSNPGIQGGQGGKGGKGGKGVNPWKLLPLDSAGDIRWPRGGRESQGL
jgi:hypothetical protein